MISLSQSAVLSDKPRNECATAVGRRPDDRAETEHFKTVRPPASRAYPRARSAHKEENSQTQDR
jgi:hypothetical protein